MTVEYIVTDKRGIYSSQGVVWHRKATYSDLSVIRAIAAEKMLGCLLCDVVPQVVAEVVADLKVVRALTPQR